MTRDVRASIAPEDSRDDVAAASPLRGLAALLDYDAEPWPAPWVPPLGHWLYFPPHARQSALGPDGHPAVSPDLPPRRMWAGSRIRFLAPIPIGVELRRDTSVMTITEKTGRSGPLLFVTVRHAVFSRGTALLLEEQDLVYRNISLGAAVAAEPAAPPSDPADQSRSLTLDATALFRFSALTFNAHRIHYDRDYATSVEGFPGLVVQGPLLATLLLDLARRKRGEPVPSQFSFRAKAPVFAGDPLRLCLRMVGSRTRLWAESLGRVAVEAEMS